MCSAVHYYRSLSQRQKQSYHILANLCNKQLLEDNLQHLGSKPGWQAVPLNVKLMVPRAGLEPARLSPTAGF